ncbi:MAG TPA: aminopeptidase P N-terminal domain-containing protein [Blastocatellia bacterium]|nr:aminopeptidase P N-terminal domain-containing protein [Blastocatellia bacterium]
MSVRLSVTFILLTALIALTIAAPAQTTSNGVSSGKDELMNQPVADFQARRRSLMQQIKDIEGKRTADARAARAKFNQQSDLTYEPIIVVFGQEEGDIGEDAKYRQKNYFAYLTGVETPSAYLILLPNEGNETLYIPPRDLANERWTGVQMGPGPEAAKKFGFQRVESTEKFMGDLFQAADDPQKPIARRSKIPVIYTISPTGREAQITREYQFANFLHQGAPNTEVKDVTPLINELRKVKSDGETTLLQRAIDITGMAEIEVSRTVRPGIYEYQLEGKILDTFVSNGAERVGFPSIVGSGINSTILHYSENQNKIEDGALVVVDIGAEYKYYTADITRTFPANGKFTPRQREIYQLVLDTQKFAQSQIKPGVTKLRDMTQIARDYMKQSPLRAKDMNGVEHTMDYFFIHGLSHYLGMDVHDVGDTSKVLQSGEVFTIEPGIYIQSEALGVRIEDDYIMTERGADKLSKNIPSEPNEIERLIAQGKAAKKP